MKMHVTKTDDREPQYGVPDDESPEWTDEDFLWAVQAKDFPTHMASYEFLKHREEILRAADAIGIPRSAFLPFAPTKPGFEARVAAAFGPFAKAIGLAAE